MNNNDDNSDEEELLAEQERKKSVTKYWDIFQILPPDADNDLVEDQTFYLLIIKILKILTYLITFLVVLSCGVLSKCITFLMTSQLKPSRTLPYCNKNYGKDRQFVAHSDPKDPLERISWYWAILFVFMVPEIFVFLRSARIWVFKGQDAPTILQFAIPMIFESLHTIGLGLLVYAVLPSMDILKALMITNGVCIIPAVFGMLSRGYDDQWIVKCVADVFAIVAQVTALFVWPIFSPQGSDDKPWILPIAAFLISFGWWENFVDVDSPFGFIRGLASMKDSLMRTRYFTYTFVSLWKMALFLGTMSLCFWINEDSISPLFEDFHAAFQRHTFPVEEKRPSIDSTNINPETGNINITLNAFFTEKSQPSVVMYVMLAQVLSGYLCFIFGKFACKICIQSFSFSFPILLVVPTAITAMVSICGMRDSQTCLWDGMFPGYFFWTCPSGEFWDDFFAKEHAWIWILWIVSQTWISLHIWNSTSERLARSERLFVTPYYNALLIDQSLAFNRRNDIKHYNKDEETGTGSDFVDPGDPAPGITDIRSEDEIPRIIACATMWHENREEMIEMLKSVFRMDADQCARRVALKYFEVADPGYYEYETNIFFDDAFQPLAVPPGQSEHFETVINSFVRTFVGTIEEAASHVHQTFVKLRPPKKIPTPYGGRLEWVLPGKTKLIVHIKDKNKIRHRKRWSQIMYMYYLLGHKLMDMPISTDRKDAIAENTYLLALDGDIDFQPNAVEYLVDLMKKNKNLGAACGRIHPIGDGPMVWYQKFEYATGHWFQKAAEHVIGCVLCSPGCFSLFRGKALMDDNVMARYTTMCTEPRHYVQYDQGEDRWLCTLLLQRGYRVEYSAASDAKTHAPEGFNEFYNQRRRWVPSTMANIMDLLMDHQKTVKVNSDISKPYIYYQMGLMVGTILGPGTIFLMLVGAFVAAFKISQWTSFGYNFLPIFIFLVVCYFCKADTQLIVAQVLSAVYALVMVAVVVAIALQIAEDGLLAPSSIFLVVVVASFLIAGILHPLEFGCLPHGFLYYITIPSMYLLLIIYSLFNMNNVSWGTREGPQTKTKAEMEAEAKAKEEEKQRKKKGMFFGLLPNSKKDENDTEGSVEFSFAGLFKIMCCTSTKPNDEKKQLERIADALIKVTSRLDDIERSLEANAIASNMGTNGRRVSSFGASSLRQMDAVAEENGNLSIENDGDAPKEIRIKRDDLMNPYWIEDKDLKKGEVDFLVGPEIKFWQELIEKYLKPIDADPKKERELADQLVELRNKSVFAFFMFNAIFVILVFLLQLEKETIHINWPLGAKSNVSYIPDSTQVEIAVEYLELEPIGLVFVGFFALVLGVQFVAMLFHRFGTFTQILAATEINWCTKDTDSITKEAAVAKHGVGLIRRLQKLRVEDEADAAINTRQSRMDGAGRRKTIHNLESKMNVETPIHNLEKQFKRNFQSFAIMNPGDRRTTKVFERDIHQTTFDALKERRSTVIERRKSVVERRKSQVLGLNPLSRSDSISPSTSSSLQQDVQPFRFQKQSEKKKPRGIMKQNSVISDNDVEMNNLGSGYGRK